MTGFRTRLVGHQQVNDAYLLGLAVHQDGVLATFDAGIAALVEGTSSQVRPLEILPDR